MKRYIALLRGINVGGKNKISMPQLKTYSKAKLSKLAGLPIYKKTTVRNANTTKKLLELINEEI